MAGIMIASSRLKDDLVRADCPGEINNAVERFCLTLGLDSMSYLVTPRRRNPDGSVPDPLALVIRPQPRGAVAAWQDVARRTRAPQIGLLHRACEATTLPVVWRFDTDENRMDGIDAVLTASQVQLYRTCVDMTGVCAGITVPLHEAGGTFGYLTWLTSDADRLTNDLAEHSDVLLAAAHRYHGAMRKWTQQSAGLVYQLSAREVECLRWMSLGRSLEETAELVGVAYGTVRFHLRTAGEKLGTAGRAHTIAKAAYLGLLGSFH